MHFQKWQNKWEMPKTAYGRTAVSKRELDGATVDGRELQHAKS